MVLARALASVLWPWLVHLLNEALHQNQNTKIKKIEFGSSGDLVDDMDVVIILEHGGVFFNAVMCCMAACVVHDKVQERGGGGNPVVSFAHLLTNLWHDCALHECRVIFVINFSDVASLSSHMKLKDCKFEPNLYQRSGHP
jgi:hypothetical protein